MPQVLYTTQPDYAPFPPHPSSRHAENFHEVVALAIVQVRDSPTAGGSAHLVRDLDRLIVVPEADDYSRRVAGNPRGPHAEIGQIEVLRVEERIEIEVPHLARLRSENLLPQQPRQLRVEIAVQPVHA